MNTQRKSLQNKTTDKIASVIIISFLLALALGSLIFLLFPENAEGKYIADIYQNGVLIQSIPLYEQEETYRFEIIGDNHCTNTVEVKPGSIAIITADCPDRICVNQGAIHNSQLPITCLPNRLVIQLRAVEDEGMEQNNKIAPDIITH